VALFLFKTDPSSDLWITNTMAMQSKAF